MVISTIGLIFDIAGVILLFFFGLPPSTVLIGALGRGIANDDEGLILKRLGRDYLCSLLGMVLVIAGFVLQIVGIWTK